MFLHCNKVFFLYLLSALCIVICLFDFVGGNAGVAYRDLPKLSRVFKDQLAYPLIAAAREGTSFNLSRLSLYCAAPVRTSYGRFIATYTSNQNDSTRIANQVYFQN